MPIAAYQGRIHDRLTELLDVIESHVSEDADDCDAVVAHEIECLASEAALAARKYLDTISKSPNPLDPFICCYTAPSPVPLGLRNTPCDELPEILIAHTPTGNIVWGMIVASQYEFTEPKTNKPIRDVLNSLLHCRFFHLQFWHNPQVRHGSQIGHPIAMRFGPHATKEGVWLDRFKPEKDYRAHVVTIVDYVAALEPLIHHEWTDKEEDLASAGMDAGTYVRNGKGVYEKRLQRSGSLIAKAKSLSSQPREGCDLNPPLTVADLTTP